MTALIPLPPAGLQTLPAARLYSVLPDLPKGTFSWAANQLAEYDGDHQEALSREWLSAVNLSRLRCINGARESIVVRANTRLRQFSERMRRADLVLTGANAELSAWADARVTECRRIFRECTDDGRRLRRLCALFERYGFTWPAGRLASPVDQAADLRPFYLRTQCAKWWRRQVRKLQAVEVENAARAAGTVGRGRELYCSDWSCRRVAAAEKRNLQTLAGVIAENDQGQEYTLAELSDLGVSNPSNRVAELMTRMAGFERLADLRGHVGEFWTMTTPSEYHAMVAAPGGSRRNEKWQGHDPRAGQEWLCMVWARIRAALHRGGIFPYGFRVAEPHHDGTPHWHLLLFMPADQVAEARRIAWRHCYKPAPVDSQKARKARFYPVAINPEKGSATGYLAKYISKNINGQGCWADADDEGDDLQLFESCKRVRSWASTYSIRQFQQIGGPSVTVWRELRRLGDEGLPGGDLFEGFLPADPVSPAGAFDDVVGAADAGDWCAFCIAMGAPDLPRDQHMARPVYMHETRYSENVNLATGEVVELPEPPKRNEYGEIPAAAIVGICFAGLVRVVTRLYDWTIRRARDGLGFDFRAAQPLTLDLCQ